MKINYYFTQGIKLNEMLLYSVISSENAENFKFRESGKQFYF